MFGRWNAMLMTMADSKAFIVQFLDTTHNMLNNVADVTLHCVEAVHIVARMVYFQLCYECSLLPCPTSGLSVQDMYLSHGTLLIIEHQAKCV